MRVITEQEGPRCALDPNVIARHFNLPAFSDPSFRDCFPPAADSPSVAEEAFSTKEVGERLQAALTLHPGMTD